MFFAFHAGAFQEGRAIAPHHFHAGLIFGELRDIDAGDLAAFAESLILIGTEGDGRPRRKTRETEATKHECTTEV